MLVWAFRWTQGQAGGLDLVYQILMGKEAWPQDTLLEGIDLSSCLQKKIWKHVAYGGESVSSGSCWRSTLYYPGL